MFQAWLVKMAKIEASSAPICRPGNRPRKKVTVKVRKPSTGTDCRMSSAGTITRSARRLLAARVATTKVNTSEAAIAANMRKVVRRPYSGSCHRSSDTAAVPAGGSGARMSDAPCSSNAPRPSSSANTARSCRLGSTPGRAASCPGAERSRANGSMGRSGRSGSERRRKKDAGAGREADRPV
ncbi:hypothetical protein NB689_003433 [Xanthomonas sacchari]|nr:hypothetical protein [Xanthomonas sacchari]